MASGKGEGRKGGVLAMRADLGAGGGVGGGNRRLKSQKQVSLRFRC